MKRFAIVGLLFLSACVRPQPCPPIPSPSPTVAPSPSPTPVPTPTPSVPPVKGPLVAQPDGTWKRDGQPWPMRMVTVCCNPDGHEPDLAKSQNWPLTSQEFVQWLSFHRQNATEIRPFMSPRHEGGKFFSPYRVTNPDAPTSQLKVDLNAWNDDFWRYTDELLMFGEGRGVVFMVGVFDTWPQDHGLSPWCGDSNVNRVDYCDSTVLRGDPPQRALDFARKVYEETGKHANVIYQDGNESFEAMSPAWTLALRDLLRRVESEKGYVRHPYGTQQRDAGLRNAVDFVTAEQDGAAAKWCSGGVCKPTLVNEDGLTKPEQKLREIYKADTLGASFAFWMGPLDQDQRGRVLIALEAKASGASLPVWAAIPDRCPSLAGIDAKIHHFVWQNQVWPEPVVGGSAVVDSTPLFGRVGPRGVCNDEHPGDCGGRICEPAGIKWYHEMPSGVVWNGSQGLPRCYLQNYAHCEDDLCSVSCPRDQGYQVKCENMRSGHYRFQPYIDDQTDCYGIRLRPPTTGTVVEWDVP